MQFCIQLHCFHLNFYVKIFFQDTSLKSKVALWNKVADKHVKGQSMNPFSNDVNTDKLHKPKISKEEYGKPPKGSLSELRAVKASIHVNREILQLCEVIHQTGERLFSENEKPNDPRIAISFGELFTVSTDKNTFFSIFHV